MESLGTVYVIGITFLFILAVLWFFLPFAIFGTKPKIDKLLVEAKNANQHLADIRQELVWLNQNVAEAVKKLGTWDSAK